MAPDRWSIRPATAYDAAAILEIYTPFVDETAVSFEEDAPSEREMADRVTRSHEWLVGEDPSGVCGYAYAAPFHPRAAYRWSVEVSIYLSERAQGQGLGRILLTELLERLRSAGFVNVFAGTTLPNPRSVALFESFGFAKIAHQHRVGFKLGTWHDVGWWQLQLREPTESPPGLESI